MEGLKPLPSPKKRFRSQSKHLLGLNIFSAGKNTLHSTTVKIILEEIIERALWRTASIEVLQRANDLKNNNSCSLTVARSEEACKDRWTSRISKFFLMWGKIKDVMKYLQRLIGVGQSSEQLVPPLEYSATESFSHYDLSTSSSETSLTEYKPSSSNSHILMIENFLLQIKNKMEETKCKISALDKKIKQLGQTLVPKNDLPLMSDLHYGDLTTDDESILESVKRLYT